jgi:hypothetical protein
MTAKQAREQTDIVSEMLTLNIQDEIHSVLKQVNEYIDAGFYAVPICNKLSVGAVEFLKRRYGYGVKSMAGNKYTTFLISW